VTGSFQKMEIVGYADRMNAVAKDVIGIKVSSQLPGSYDADLVRIVSADRAPGGAGFEEHVVPAAFAGRYAATARTGNPGSHALVDPASLQRLPALERSGFTLQAMIHPTLPAMGRQGLCGTWRPGAGASLIIENGELALLYADGEGRPCVVRSGQRIVARRWQLVSAAIDPIEETVTLTQWPVMDAPAERRAGPQAVTLALAGGISVEKVDSFTFAGILDPSLRPKGQVGDWIVGHYNGRLDRVRWAGKSLTAAEVEVLGAHERYSADLPAVLGFWDFSKRIDTVEIEDVGPYGLHGRTVNLPTRAVTGFNWDGSEHNWRHAPEMYGAIHFHDDDVHDLGWPNDFTVTIPDDAASAIYAVRLRMGGHEYRIPLFVREALKSKRALIAYVASTATYQAYANNVRTAELVYGATQDESLLDEVYLTLKAHPEFGRSLYDTHSDGGGFQYSSALRPMVDVQPGTRKPWSLQADLLVTAWLERSGYAFDIVTDHDLHRDGREVLEGYRLVITGSHPEYMSLEIRTAYDAHLASGGRLVYLGGNGFYLRVAFSDKIDGAMEMRRVAQPLVGLWKETAGNHYLSFTGELGGLWSNQHNPPNLSVGVGFTNLMIGDELTFEQTEVT
jgi:N,N-dimethylformamidase